MPSDKTIIRISVADMAELANQAERDWGDNPTGTRWPTPDELVIVPDNQIPYDGRYLHGVLATPGHDGGPRPVLIVMYDGDYRDQHRSLTFDADSGQASQPRGWDGDQSREQTERDGRLISALLKLLASDDGEIREIPPSAEQIVIRNSMRPIKRWERHASSAQRKGTLRFTE